MAKNIFDATSPLSFMAKFCGYSMFTINQSDFTIASKRNDVIAQIWIIIMNVFFCAYLWDVGQNFNLHKSDILSKSLPIILSGSYGFYIFTIIASIALRRKQSTLMRLFYEIDEMLEEFGIKFNYKQQKCVLIYSFGAMFLIDIGLVAQFAYIQYVFKVSTNKFSKALSYYWVLQCYTVFIIRFVFMVRIVKERFEKLNECLQKQDLLLEEIQKLATVHHIISETINVINQIYSNFMMLFFAGIFCVFNLFLFSLVITRNYYGDSNESMSMTVGNFEWNLYDLMLIFIVIQSTTAASAEGKRTRDIIFKIVNASTDEKLNGRLMNFSHQITSSRLDFSCGLFKYDWSLCFKFLGAAVMYLVILIQFETALPKKNY